MRSVTDKYFYISSFLLISIISIIGYVLKREDFYVFYPSIIASFGFFYHLVNQQGHYKKLIALGFLIRFILVFCTPELSDDFYRFLWDGNLLKSGFNPFTILPTEVLDRKLIDQSFLDLFPLLNSQDYYTVYPTIIQVINFISVYIGQTVVGSMIVMKLIFLAFECLSFYFLNRLLILFNKPKNHIFWYWLCPLIALEFVGNLHHECIMITFILGSIWYLKSNKIYLSAIFIALAIFTKLTPILFLPFLIFSISIKQNIKFIPLLLISCLAMAFPIYYNEGYVYLFKSIKLYFSSFEFNSGLYQIALYIEHEYWKGFRLIYKLVVILIMGIWLLYSQVKKVNLIYGLAIVYFIYVISAQSIHPWYILPLLPLYILTEIPKYYLFWMLIIPLTYITYINIEYQQKIWINILEYIGILFVIIIYDNPLLRKNNQDQSEFG